MTDYTSAPPPPDGEGQPQSSPPPEPARAAEPSAAPPPPPGGPSAAPPPPPAAPQAAPPPAMPGYDAPPARGPVAQPASIALAVKLMYAGAALSLLGIVITFLMRDSIREGVEKASREATTPMTSSQIDAAVGIGIGLAVLSGLIGVALWLWMAAANGRGRSWARIVATVFYGLNVLLTLVSLARKPPALSLVLALVSLGLGGYIIFLLFKKESSDYYAAQSAPRY